MKRTNICTTIALVSACIIATSCSTTKRISESEQLYVGIQNIDYTDRPISAKKRKKGTQEEGVITSFAEAYTAIDQILTQNNHRPSDEIENSKLDYNTLTKEQKKALKQSEKITQKAFDTASEEINAALSYAPNNSLLGSAKYRIPFPMGLWFYTGFAKKRGVFNKWVYRKLAKEPVLVSYVNPLLRTQVATNTLYNYGYFNGNVSYDILDQKDPKKAKVLYTVTLKNLHKLDSVAYLNFSAMEDSLLRSTQQQSRIRSGDPFSVINLDAERMRISMLFRNNGYYFYAPEFTQFRADTVARKGWVQLQVIPSEQRPLQARKIWYVGETFITVQEQQELETPTNKFTRQNFSYKYSGDKIPVRTGIFLRTLQQNGELYQLAQQNRSIEQLNGVGIFSAVNISYQPRDTTALCDTLDIHVTARLDKPYDAEFELNATSKSNNQVGPGLVFGLTRRNAFRGGEKVVFKVFGSYEWQTKTSAASSGSLINSFEYGTSLSFDFPRIYFPWLAQKRYQKLSSTSFVLNANWKNRANYFNMLSLGASATYSFHSSEVSRHEIVPFSISYDELISQTDLFRDIIDQNPVLYISMRSQFIPSIQYTYTYTSATTKRNPIWWQTSITEAGNLFSSFYVMAGNSFSSNNKKFFGNPFAQFAKFTTEYRKTFDLGHAGKIATRAMGGVIFAYGNSVVAPYSEQFYIGGANSIRAFAVRAVGPGFYKPTQTRYAYLDQTGDLKFEFNVEYRFPILGNIHGATFIDAGNVWLLKKDDLRPNGQFDFSTFGKDIAVGTGVGLRYDLEFLVLRLDLGLALHLPYNTGKRGYYNIPKFTDGLGVHLAVGYPF